MNKIYERGEKSYYFICLATRFARSLKILSWESQRARAHGVKTRRERKSTTAPQRANKSDRVTRSSVCRKNRIRFSPAESKLRAQEEKNARPRGETPRLFSFRRTKRGRKHKGSVARANAVQLKSYRRASGTFEEICEKCA